MVSLFTRLATGTAFIVVIAEGVEYYRGMAFPEQQWVIVPLIMIFTILAMIVHQWISMKQYVIRRIPGKGP